MIAPASDITAALGEWLPQQRWFAGKSRHPSVTARLLATMPDRPDVQIWIVDATYGDDDVEHYQVPIEVRSDPAEGMEHAFIGAIDVGDAVTGTGIAYLYDALHDKDVTGCWLQAIAGQERHGAVTFELTGRADEIPVGAESLVMAGEQSNTSLVFGNAAIMKVFRRLEAGLNPDIEVHAALEQLGGRHVARLLGYVGADIDGSTWSLAMLQEFMTTATDGWQMATASVRDLMAEADLHAAEAGGDFAAEAERLGVSTAEVHADLATAFGVQTLQARDLIERAAAMNSRLDTALYEVPELAEVSAGLRELYQQLAEFDQPIAAQRIHGDLHLGQVLRTVQRWIMLDFEGEPAKTIAERRTVDSPLRDVAGMQRSFDYAARHRLIDIETSAQSEFRACEWAERNRDAYWRGYLAGGGVEPAGSALLLQAFEADKAVYEAVYEARNRPHWLPIPLASLSRLATRGTP